MASPFEFADAINRTKKDIMVDDIEEKSYNGYMVNRALSQFIETTLFANEMNIHHRADNKMQFHYLLNSVRQGKRTSKWAKATQPDDMEAIKTYYGYSNEKAKVALSVLTKDQIDEIKRRIYTGGTKALKV